MTNENTGEGLKRVIGVPALAMSIINNSIGSGIFALPAIVGIELGAFGIFCYLFCALMLAAIMLCYAEIGSRITKSGGSYTYVEAAFGPFAGFVINWLYFFGWGILGSAAVMNVLADSLSVLFPVFDNALVRAVLYAVLLGLMVIINVYGAKNGARFVQALTVIKLLPLFALIFFALGKVKMANLHWDHLPPLKSFADTTLVLFYAFAGFEVSLNVSGEIKNPRRTVPAGIVLGGILVLLVYMLIQLITQGVLGAGVAAFKAAPLEAIAGKIIGPAGISIIVAAAVVSCAGIASGDVMATPRLLFAGANNGMFPKFLGKVHPRFATPYISIIVYTAAIFVFSVSGGFKQLAALASGAILLIYLAVILSTLRLRAKNRDTAEKTFRIPGGPIVPLIGIASIIWLLTSLSRVEVISVVVFIAAICVIYFVMNRLRK